jgi:hypothetical protein
MKAMLDARMVAARIQGAAAGTHGALAGAARTAASSQGSLVKLVNVGQQTLVDRNNGIKSRLSLPLREGVG